MQQQQWFIAAIPPWIPGVNGTSAMALRALSADVAAAEGFGKGEYSGWLNNLRALAGAGAAYSYGQIYAWSLRKGIYAGWFFWIGMFVGAVVPELLLWCTSDAELKPPDRAPDSTEKKT